MKAECWMTCCNLRWMKCHLQIYFGFTLSKMEHHLISLARCETGLMNFFPIEELEAEDESNGHQDSRTSCPLNFSSVVIWSYLCNKHAHLLLTTLKKYPCCYYRHHTLDFRTFVIQCATSCQPVRATRQVSSWTSSSLVPFPVKSDWWDPHYNYLVVNWYECR
jgi:hypothetical protein